MTVRMDNVSLSYQARSGTVQALREMTLDASEGEFLAIIGPSGCGKSTLLKVAAGLLSPDTGRVSLADTDVFAPRTDVGMMFQTPVLLPWKSVLDNVLLQAQLRGLPRKEYREKAIEILASVGLHGYEGSYVFELSGGMQQRVSFCRAILHNPQVLLMDEPFGALDALTREQLSFDLQRMWRAHGRQTVLFVTHSIAEAALLADRVIVCTGRPARVLENVNVDIPRPRRAETMNTAAFGGITSRLRKLVREASSSEHVKGA